MASPSSLHLQQQPVSRVDNNGFGRNETQLHFHNAHNGAESAGAANVHHFPGTFNDDCWSATLARATKSTHKRRTAGVGTRRPSPYGVTFTTPEILTEAI